mmetsp:Transcript_4645/g.9322  ORF Transcript_4645/g.9322 Transcript_4645/m.9322 type:complete len:91 (-) Transcript_4645:3052-3324(-)
MMSGIRRLIYAVWASSFAVGTSPSGIHPWSLVDDEEGFRWPRMGNVVLCVPTTRKRKVSESNSVALMWNNLWYGDMVYGDELSMWPSVSL